MRLRIKSDGGQRGVGVVQAGVLEVRESHKDTRIGGHRKDQYIADASAYNRFFPCMEANLLP